MKLTDECEENLMDLISTYGHKKILKYIKKDREFKKQWIEERVESKLTLYFSEGMFDQLNELYELKNK